MAGATINTVTGKVMSSRLILIISLEHFMLTVYNHSDKPATHSMGLEKWDLLIWYGIRKDN